MKNKLFLEKTKIVLLATICLLIIISIAFLTGAIKNNSESSIPTIEDVLENGYPKNELGETYGPDLGNNSFESPDLQLAEATNGKLGYVRTTELDDNYTRADVLNSFTRQKTSKTVKVYLEDGKTVIGKFVLT